MIVMRVDESLCLHSFLIEELVAGAKVSLNKVILSSSMSEEEMGLSTIFQVH
jgi:hypothetical protein